jgi:hypothetical protein
MIQIKTRLLNTMKPWKTVHRILYDIVVFHYIPGAIHLCNKTGFGKGSVKCIVDLDHNGSSQAFKAARNVFEKPVILFLNLHSQRKENIMNIIWKCCVLFNMLLLCVFRVHMLWLFRSAKFSLHQGNVSLEGTYYTTRCECD